MGEGDQVCREEFDALTARVTAVAARLSTPRGTGPAVSIRNAGRPKAVLAELATRDVSGPPGSSKPLGAFTRTDALGVGASASCREVVVTSGWAAALIAERGTGL